MSTVEVRVPDMGNFESVTVIDVLVKPGDTIDIETPLVTLETDKATMDVPSTAKGVVEKVHVAKGGSVSTGALIVTVKAEVEVQPAATGCQGCGFLPKQRLRLLRLQSPRLRPLSPRLRVPSTSASPTWAVSIPWASSTCW